MSRKLPVLSPYIYPFFIGCVWVISFLEVCNPRHLCPLRHRSSDAFLDGLHQGPSREGLFFLFSVLLLIQICEKLFMKSKMYQWSIHSVQVRDTSFSGLGVTYLELWANTRRGKQQEDDASSWPSSSSSYIHSLTSCAIRFTMTVGIWTKRWLFVMTKATWRPPERELIKRARASSKVAWSDGSLSSFFL